MADGWRSPKERQLASWARRRGWRVGERNGMGHLVMVWPATGAKVPIAGDPSGSGRSVANAKAQLQRTEELGTSRPGGSAVRSDDALVMPSEHERELEREIKRLRTKCETLRAGAAALQARLDSTNARLSQVGLELAETWLLAEAEAEGRAKAEAKLRQQEAEGAVAYGPVAPAAAEQAFPARVAITSSTHGV